MTSSPRISYTGCWPSNARTYWKAARYVNSVALRHGEVSQEMFPHFRINAITNGVHGTTWAAPAFAQLFDRQLPEWRRDNLYLGYAVGIPLVEIRQAHAAAKAELVKDVAERTGVYLQPDVLTVGLARRATEYKRTDLLFTDLDRLRRIAHQAGALQVVYSGKAHPQDETARLFGP